MTVRFSQELFRSFGAAFLDIHTREGEEGVIRALAKHHEDGDDAQAPMAAAVLALVTREWAKCGFPSVRCGPRLGESLMATSIPGSAIPELLAPWQTVFLELPTNTLVAHELVEANGWGREYFTGVFLQNHPSGSPDHLEKGLQSGHANWIMWPVSAGIGMHAPVKFRSLAEMADSAADGLDVVSGDMFGDRRDPEERDATVNSEAISSTMLMLLRFVLGVLLEMNGAATQQDLARHKQNAKNNGRSGGGPKAWVFKLTRPVVVDCREYVRTASSRGERFALTVQRLVRGHWKNQPHGAGATERKFIHISPYWRGPEDAPIAVSPHVIKDPKKKPDGQGGAPPEAAE